MSYVDSFLITVPYLAIVAIVVGFWNVESFVMHFLFKVTINCCLSLDI